MNSGGLKYSWTPSDPSRTLRLVDYLGLKGSHDNWAFFTYSVPPSKAVQRYDLGTMNLMITNADGQQLQTSMPVTAATRAP